MGEMKILWILMCAISTVGILSQVWLVHVNIEMINGNSLTRQIKLKYATCKKLGVTVNNTQVFVEKLFDNYRTCGLSLTGMGNIIQITMYICILLGLVGAYVYRQEVPQLIMIVGLSVACFCLLKVVALLVDADERFSREKVELIDSLENYNKSCDAELEQELERIQQEEPLVKKHFSKEAESEFQKMSVSFAKIAERQDKPAMDEALIREILEEYL